MSTPVKILNEIRLNNDATKGATFLVTSSALETQHQFSTQASTSSKPNDNINNTNTKLMDINNGAELLMSNNNS